jgi:hypothetical protein
MNSKGKHQTSQYLAEFINLTFDQPLPSSLPIPIPWTTSNTVPSDADFNHSNNQASVVDAHVTQMENSPTVSLIPQQTVSKPNKTDPQIDPKGPNRISNRPKKHPQSSTDDFLWYAQPVRQKTSPN